MGGYIFYLFTLSSISINIIKCITILVTSVTLKLSPLSEDLESKLKSWSQTWEDPESKLI